MKGQSCMSQAISAHHNFAVLAYASLSNTFTTDNIVHISSEIQAAGPMCTMLFVIQVLDFVYATEHGPFLCGYAEAVELMSVAAFDPEVPDHCHTAQHSSCASAGSSGLMSTAASDVEAPDQPEP